MFASLRGPWHGDMSVSLRAYVTAAMLVVLLPLLGHAVLVTWYSYSASRQWAEQDLMGDAEHLAEDVDTRLDVARSVMQIVSQSPAVRRGDLAAVRELLTSARSSGLIRAAAVTDPQGGGVAGIGFRPGGEAAIAGPSEHLLAGRVEGEPVLAAALPLQSADPRLARLEFAVSVAVLRSIRGGDGAWPWHVTAVTDRNGQMVWSAQAKLGPEVLRQIHDPAAVAGVVHDWIAPDGVVHTIGYARAQRTGLTVIVAQPSPGLYERVPFGPLWAVVIAVGVTVLSVVLARLGALYINAAYQGAMRGTRGSGLLIAEATQLGAELRSSRDRLFQAVGGIAVVELTRAPGQRWGEAGIEASDSIRSMLGLERDEAVTVERLLRDLAPEDRAALAATMTEIAGQASVFTRMVRTLGPGQPVRHFNLVGMLREAGPGEPAQLLLTLQDVTAQKETEVLLRAQASRLRLATDIAGLGVWERDPAQGVGHASDRIWEIMGRPPQDLLDMETYLAAVHPDDRARLAQAVNVRLPSEEPQGGSQPSQVRYRIVRPDGGVRHVRSSRVFVDDPDGDGSRVVGVLVDETEAVMAQRALAASEARFRLAVDVAELGVFERYIDPHRNVGVWNERMWRMRGLEPRAEPMPYAEMLAMVHPEDRERIAATMLERRTQGDGTTDYEFRIVRPDGEERIIQSRSVRTQYPEDRAFSIVAINLDVTERRRAEQALRESAAELRLAVETAQLGFAQVDPATGQGMWNERLYALYDLPARTGRPTLEEVLERVHPDDRATMLADLARQRAAPDEQPVDSVFRIVRPDGQERILQVRSVRRLRPDGSATVSTVTLDVTERRLSEQVLREGAARLQLAVETAELGVAYLDPVTGKGTWNERLFHIYGLAPNADRPAMAEWMTLVHPEDRDRVTAAIAAQRDGAPGSVVEAEFRIRRPDGQERILQVRSLRLVRDDGSERLSTVTRDVTGSRRAELVLAASEARLRLAVETAELGVAELDIATGAGVWNEQQYRICGLEPGGGRPPLDQVLAMVHPEDREMFAQEVAALRQAPDGYGREMEVRIRRPDGAERVLHLHSTVVRQPSIPAMLLTVTQDITERRAAEIALQERTAALEVAIESANLGLWTRDPDQSSREASPRLWAMLGMPGRTGVMTREDLLGVVHPDDLAAVSGAAGRPWPSPDIDRVDARIIWPDGQVRYIHASRVVLRDAAGQPRRVIGLMADQTEIRRAAEALAESEARSRLAVETAELGVADRDVITGQAQWNDRLYQIMGVAPGQPLGIAETMAMIHPEDRALVEAIGARHEAGEDGFASEYDYRIVRPDGQVRILHARSVTLRTANGGVRRLSVNQDVTERRLAEQALAESEARFRLAVDTAELGVADRNLTTGEATWSDRLYGIMGIEPGGLPLGDDPTLAIIHPEDRSVIAGIRARHAHSEPGFVSEYDYRMLRPNGEVRTLHARSVTLRGADGSVRLLSVNQDVTEQRRAVQSLADSEMRLRLAVDAAGLGIWDYDKRADRTVWSDRMWRIRGLEPSAEGPTRAQTLEAVVEEDRAALLRFWDRIGAGDEDISYEYRVRWPNGAIRHISGLGRLVRDADGEVVRVVGVSADITERRLAELQVAESELRLRLATEVTGLGIWDHDPGTGKTFWSEQMFRLRGLEGQGEAPDLDFIDAHTVQQDRAVVMEKWASLKDGKASLSVQYRAVWPDGTVRWLRSEGRSLYDAQGRVIRMLGVVMDVTDQREAEIALLDRTTTLELAIEAADLGIWTRAPGENTRIASARVWAMLGHPGREGPMTREELIASLHPDDRAAVLREWVPADGEPVPRQREFRAIWPDGTVRHFQSRRAVMRDAQGQTLRIIGLIADVTEARRAAAALAASEARLRLAVDSAELGIFDYDPNTREGYWSDRTWRMRGLEPREGIPTFDEVAATIHPEDREAAVAKGRMQFTAPDGTRIDNEFRVVWPDGTVRHILLRAVVRRAEDGTPRVFGVNMDVTERRAAALALEASEARLRLAVETAGLGVFDVDPVTREGQWSERMWRMRGRDPQPGKPTHDEAMAMVHPDDRARVMAHAREQAELPEGAVSEFEIRFVWPDGAVHYIQSRSIAQRGPDGRVERIFGINLDVTESRLAAEALRETAARYELAVDAAEMGVFEFDPESRTGYWSDRIWLMRGLEPRPGTLSFEEVIELVHPADREQVAGRMRDQFAGPDGMRGEYEFRIVRPDGTVRYIQSRAVTQRRPDGRLHRLFGVNLDVTERRLAAQALEASEARLRLASEAAGLGVFQANMPDGSGYWSDRMWRIRGMEPRPGLPGSEVAVAAVHPDDRDIVRGLRQAATTWPSGEPVRHQYRVVWPDGTLRHVASYALVLTRQEAGAFSLIGVNIDITEQVEREQALREAAARFELAIDAADLAVWDWDPATDRMNWSPRIWQMVGIAPRGEVPPVEMRQRAVHPDDRGQVPTAWIRSVAEGDDRRGQGDFRVVRPDGSMRYLNWQGIPLRDGGGRIVRFAGVVADVTEARLAELALRTSEELFRMAAEASEQGVWNHDLLAGTITWSERLWRIHGLAPQEGAPTLEARAAFIHPEDRAEVLDLREELEAAPPNTVMRRSYRILRADGAVRMVDRQAMLVAGADGRPVRIVGVVQDVTEARELAAQTMVADKLATLGEMAGAIAHELAQPLQAVMATAATARVRLTNGSDAATLERVCDRLAWIERQTSRAGKTIQHLLAFSRGESSEGFSRLGDAVEGAMELAGHGLRRDRVEVELQMPADLPPVRGGQIAIEQVLVNLLNNARDAMAERPTRRIVIAGRAEGDSVMLDVTDTGGGVAADKMERIFEPFYTTKPVGRGTGIGLSVARRTMKALGGGISVANTGTGACFSLRFRNAGAGM